MNIIYILPSWYPSREMPNFGSFIREQSELMAKNHPEYRIIVGFRADKDLRLSFF